MSASAASSPGRRQGRRPARAGRRERPPRHDVARPDRGRPRCGEARIVVGSVRQLPVRRLTDGRHDRQDSTALRRFDDAQNTLLAVVAATARYGVILGQAIECTDEFSRTDEDCHPVCSGRLVPGVVPRGGRAGASSPCSPTCRASAGGDRGSPRAPRSAVVGTPVGHGNGHVADLRLIGTGLTRTQLPWRPRAVQPLGVLLPGPLNPLGGSPTRWSGFVSGWRASRVPPRRKAHMDACPPCRSKLPTSHKSEVVPGDLAVRAPAHADEPADEPADAVHDSWRPPLLLTPRSARRSAVRPNPDSPLPQRRTGARAIGGAPPGSPDTGPVSGVGAEGLEPPASAL